MGRLTDWGRVTLAVSEDIRAYLLGNYSVRDEDIIMTVNGIDTDKFLPERGGSEIRREFGLSADDFVVTNVSRLDPFVAAPTRRLIEAAPELSLSIPRLRLLIVGGANPQRHDDVRCEEALRALAASINRELGRDCVIMTGARVDVEKILAATDLYVGVSRAALEALSSGKPAILAGFGGYLGLFTRDKLSAAVETNFTCRGYGEVSSGALARDIADYYNNRGKYAELGAFGRELILGRYSVAKMADDALAAYDRALRARFLRVVMSGYYGFGNAGDEAILQAEYGKIRAAGAAEITVLSKNPAATRARLGCRCAGRFNPFAALWALWRADVLVFGGGSLLQDRTSTRSILYYTAILRCAALLRRRIMIYANGIGPIVRAKNRARVAGAVRNAEYISLRDEDSLAELVSMGIPAEKLCVTADPVFTMEQAQTAIASVRALPYIIIAARQEDEAIFPQIARLCSGAARARGVEICFLPMQTGVDAAASERIIEILRREYDTDAKILSAHDITEVFALFAGASAVVTARLHALIFAACVYTPVLGIDVDPKMRAYLAELCQPNLGAPEALDADRAATELLRAIDEREIRAQKLRSRVAVLRERARQDDAALAALFGG
jgi:polysaccharide pyruvyl transferase CsaB